jgi:hypothetical protein
MDTYSDAPLEFGTPASTTLPVDGRGFCSLEGSPLRRVSLNCDDEQAYSTIDYGNR